MAKAKKGDVIFHRGKGSDHDDIWDDSVLIEAYEQSVSLAYDAVRASLQSNGEYSADELKQHGTKADNSRERKDSAAGNGSVSTIETDEKKKKRKKRKSQRKKWQVGDKCLAKYSEDGEWYEAEIIAIDRVRNCCTVRYTEYENEEDVNLGMLEKAPETSLDEESMPSDGDGDGGDLREYSGEEAIQWQAITEQNPFGFNTVPLLPPPVPPHLLRHHDGVPQEDEAMASMLMSWYTSGYHTGYYQAMRDMKKAKK